MRRFLPGVTSFKSSSSVRLENILLALSTTSRQELIATCTDNLWDVIVISLSFDPCPSFVQRRPSAIARKRVHISAFLQGSQGYHRSQRAYARRSQRAA